MWLINYTADYVHMLIVVRMDWSPYTHNKHYYTKTYTLITQPGLKTNAANFLLDACSGFDQFVYMQ